MGASFVMQCPTRLGLRPFPLVANKSRPPPKAFLSWVVLPWLLLKRTFNRQGLRREVSSFSSAVPLLAKRNGVVEAAFMEEWSFRNMSKLPPVPPENRSNKGPGADPKIATDEKAPP